MTDPLAALGALGGAAKALDPNSETVKLGTSLWGDVLGPPAKALGSHFAKRIERWSESEDATRVLKLAAQKTDTTKAGNVPPRVATAVLDAAEFSDDEFVAEYLSGVRRQGHPTARMTEEWLGRLSSVGFHPMH